MKLSSINYTAQDGNRDKQHTVLMTEILFFLGKLKEEFPGIYANLDEETMVRAPVYCDPNMQDLKLQLGTLKALMKNLSGIKQEHY
jgi:hypothetical protein